MMRLFLLYMKRQDKTNFWDWAFRALAAAIVIAVCIIAHEHDIQTPPAVVDKAFSEMYGGATEVEWEKHLNGYNVEFIYDRHEMEAQFSKKGIWKSTRKEIAVSEVPDEVMKSIAEQNTGSWQIDDVYLHTAPQGNKEYYRIELDKEMTGREKTLCILPNGTVMKM